MSSRVIEPRLGIASVIALLDQGRPEASCAAAIVLGEIVPTHPRVRRALEKRLNAAPAHVRPYVRAALAQSGTDTALGRIAADLRRGGVAREQAVRLIGAEGNRALPHLDRLLFAHPDESLRHVFGIAATLETSAAAMWLVGHLRDASPARARSIGRALPQKTLHAWPRPLRQQFRQGLVALLQAGRFASVDAVRVAFGMLGALVR